MTEVWVRCRIRSISGFMPGTPGAASHPRLHFAQQAHARVQARSKSFSALPKQRGPLSWDRSSLTQTRNFKNSKASMGWNAGYLSPWSSDGQGETGFHQKKLLAAEGAPTASGPCPDLPRASDFGRPLKVVLVGRTWGIREFRLSASREFLSYGSYVFGLSNFAGLGNGSAILRLRMTSSS